MPGGKKILGKKLVKPGTKKKTGKGTPRKGSSYSKTMTKLKNKKVKKIADSHGLPDRVTKKMMAAKPKKRSSAKKVAAKRSSYRASRGKSLSKK